MACILAFVCMLIGVFIGMLCYSGTMSVLCAIFGGAFSAWCVYWLIIRNPRDWWWEDDD